MGHSVCFSCRVVARRLGLPLAPVVPARLCPLPGPLYTVLLGFKESPVAEARLHFCTVVRTLLRAFLLDDGGRLETTVGGPIDVVTLVPSTHRPGPPPCVGWGSRPRRRPGGRCRRRVARGALGSGSAAPDQPWGRVAARGPHAT